jgi:hypothetical protein
MKRKKPTAEPKWIERAKAAAIQAAMRAAERGVTGAVFGRQECIVQLPYPDLYRVKPEAFDEALNGLVKDGALERVMVKGRSPKTGEPYAYPMWRLARR